MLRFIVTTLLFLAMIVPGFARDFSLESLQSRIERDYGGVRHLSPAAFAKMQARPSDLLLLDVREEDEFAVSHIPGAIQVSPGIWQSTFMSRFAGRIEGRTVVFYCSVGVRSSRLAARLSSALRAAGAAAVYNLAGGIFAWHNSKRPLENAEGRTPYVHPYDSYWGRLLTHRGQASTTPR